MQSVLNLKPEGLKNPAGFCLKSITLRKVTDSLPQTEIVYHRQSTTDSVPQTVYTDSSKTVL